MHGRVQGVGFRYFTLRVASRLGLAGWVANDPSGRVRVVAEGDHGALEELLAALRSGPPGAFVDRVDETWPPPTGTLLAFEVRSGWHGGD